ncbi:MAG TPA: M14 family zinc carboxypeptidase, partial [Thermoleophilaceae bacterium]|nr:M14 family zinc carboxypeptidase [Thermoleophilaceae bacterium]
MVLAAIFASLAALAPVPQPGVAPAPHAAPVETIGTSAEGRPIRAQLVGSRRAPVKLLVVGSIHGNEPAGRAITRRLRRSRPPRGTALWI